MGTRPVWRLRARRNPLVLWAVAAQAVLLALFLGLPPLADLLGGTWPDGIGWALAFAAIPAVTLVDAAVKAVRRRRVCDVAWH